ncbi:release factor glutamine methyltransferase [Neisseria sp. HSC-16F19]|nr:peptide chain release factor N(5)-glutamine methyltransferase [Neisseria sp. HSC-16F19]MCP2041029.1 release factor glutamine methyltransferase [Neisseria sp. HSC-16F19]
MNDTSVPTVAAWLRASGLPRVEARLLLQHVCGWSHAQIIARSEERLPENLQAALNQAAQRRQNGEPMAYITGTREFYGRAFKVSPAVLIPRPETEHLLEAALAKLPPGGVLWDLGCGSGAIAVSAACERPDAVVWAADISADALAVAADNARTLGAAVHFGQGGWFAATPRPAIAGVDVLVSNPPYIEADDVHLSQGDLRFEPPQALTDFGDGLSALRQLAAGAGDYLRPGGWLLLEHGYNQGAAVRALLAEYGYAEIETLQDLAGLDRVTLGCKAA